MYFDVEPITGVPMSGVVSLQINVEYEGDDGLFPKNYAMVPIISIYAGVNMTESQTSTYFGKLKIALISKIVIFYVGIVIGSILTLGSLFSLYYSKKIRKNKVSTSLL